MSGSLERCDGCVEPDRHRGVGGETEAGAAPQNGGGRDVRGDLLRYNTRIPNPLIGVSLVTLEPRPRG